MIQVGKRKKKNSRKDKKNKAITTKKSEQQLNEKAAEQVPEQTENQPKEKRHLRKVGAYELDEEVAEILQDIKLHSNTMF